LESFVTPLLVASQTPNYWALYVYLAIVTAAALALARLRLWRWLAITAVILGTLWTLPGVAYPRVDELGAHLFHVVSGFILVAAPDRVRLALRTDRRTGKARPNFFRRAGRIFAGSDSACYCECSCPRGADGLHDS
jgi:uncharacterized membrane protein